MNKHLIRPKYGETVLMEVTPESAGWDSLHYKVIELKAGESFTEATEGNEAAVVTLSGNLKLKADDQSFEVSRAGVFIEKSSVLYVPPGKSIEIEAVVDSQFSIGAAPAEGKYPTRLFTPDEMPTVIRGEGGAKRQVFFSLAHPLPAERLIVFEVYVPGGHWSGWPPHCHDGYGDSVYLEETYYFRTEPETGVAWHRNYRVDKDFDEIIPAHNGELVLVTEGFHSTAATPGTNLYFLNYLAGDLYDDARSTPPFDDPTHAWILDDWEKNSMNLPLFDD